MTKGPHTIKVRDEGHWRPAVDGVAFGNKYDTKQAALERARLHVLERFELEPGEERLVSEVAKELGIPSRYVEDLPDTRDDYNIHVADQVDGGTCKLPRKNWTIHREAE